MKSFVIFVTLQLFIYVVSGKPPRCKEADLETLWPDYDDKELYYQCIDIGESIQLKCLFGTWFDFYEQKCVLKEDWKPTTTVRPTTEETTAAPITTPGPTPSPTPVPTPSPTPVPTPSPTPVPTPSPTPVPTPSPTPIPTPSPTPVPTPTPAPLPPTRTTSNVPQPSTLPPTGTPTPPLPPTRTTSNVPQPPTPPPTAPPNLINKF